MSEMVIFDQHTERYTKAWNAFNQLYILERPQPDAPKWHEGLPWLMIPFGVIAIFSIALSSLRTAPVFQQIALPLVGPTFALVEAVLAVVVIEVSVVIMRYVHVLQQAEDGKLNHDELRSWMLRGFLLAFIVALLANLYASVRHQPVIAEIAPMVDLIMSIAVGASAPFLAFIAGDILASLYLRSDRRRAELRARFDTALQEWQDARERSWNARKGDYGLRLKVENLSPSVLPSASVLSEQTQPTQTLPAASGFQRTPDGQQRVIDYLTARPEDAAMPSRQLAARIADVTGVRVGHDTANKGRNAWRDSLSRTAPTGGDDA